MNLKQRTIEKIIMVEGGYVNNPDDSGGETNFGITKEVARANGYRGPMIDLPREVAYDIYVEKHWDILHADELVSISQIVAEEVVDTGVNMGVDRAAKFLQRCINVFNNKGNLYDDIVVDGVVGSATITALAMYVEVRDELVMAKALNSLQGAFYVELAEKDEKNETFMYGWMRARVII